MEGSSESKPQLTIKDRVSSLWHKLRPNSAPLTPVAPTESDNIPQEIISPDPQNEETAYTPEVDIPVAVYVGLEQIDKLDENVPLFEGYVEHSVGERRDFIIQKLAELEAERKEIIDRYNIQPLIDADLDERKKTAPNYEYHRPVSHAKGIARLLIINAARNLPPITKDGFIRMYRGEGPHDGKTDDDWSGTWFSHDLNKACAYPLGAQATSRMIFVDIPEKLLGAYHAEDRMPGSSKGGEYLLPRESVGKAKEFIRFLTVDTKDDPWKPDIKST